MKIQSITSIMIFFLLFVGCQNNIHTEIAKGVNRTPDKVKKEFHEKWTTMESNWPMLSSNATNYMATKGYKDFKEHVLTADPSVYYLVAEKWMEAPLGLHAFLFSGIINTKFPKFGQKMIEKYHKDGNVNSFSHEEVDKYIDFVLELAHDKEIK